MSHLDEGTIHAWLDGALPQDEAARVEAHARDCAECAAMIAEARGFVAGASRIVSSLDVVRGNVIPAAAGASTTPTKSASRRSLWKTLKFTPARAAIAATILVGVASMLTLRHQDSSVATTGRVQVAPTVATPAAGPAASAPVPAAASPAPVAPARVPTEPRALASRPTSQPQKARDTTAPKREAGIQALAENKAVASAAAVEPRMDSVASGASQAPARAARRIPVTTPSSPAASAPAPVAALNEVVVTGATSGSRDSSAANRAKAPAAAALAGGALRDANAMMPRPSSRMAQPPFGIEARVVGCYRVSSDPPLDLRGFPAEFRLARDSMSGRPSVLEIGSARDSVLDGADWHATFGNTVVVRGLDAQRGSISIEFVLDSTRARVIRSRSGAAAAMIQRMSCPR